MKKAELTAQATDPIPGIDQTDTDDSLHILVDSRNGVK